MNTRFLRVWLSCLVLAPMGVRARAEAPEVPVARAMVREVTDHEDFTGRTEAAARVDLRARVSGYLLKAAFQEGAEVKKDDVLFEIDSRVYRAELDKVEAALTLAEARFKLAEANHKRMKTLFDRKAVGQEDRDRATGERTVAEAEVRAIQAGREVARLNLDFARVRAPLDGRIGRRTVDPGNLVKADDTILATIVSRDPVHVYFDVDERSALRLLRSVRAEKGKAEKATAAVGLADEDGFPRRGMVDLTDNRVNADTGTLRMRAVLPNKDGLLLPGLFVRVRLAMGAPYKALTVPEQVVMVEDGQKFVFVVNDKDAIEQRAVVIGQKIEDRRVVTRGLKAEERVVVGRLSALRPGMTVRPREQEKPEPKPKQSSDSGSSPVPSAHAQGAAGIAVEAVYPGANAEVVSDVVRSPIEQAINGVEKLRLMRSRCTSDGKYALALSFGRGVDLKIMQVMVQNRVNLAVPKLPEMVRRAGISIKRGTSGVAAIVALSSPDGDRDSLYLGNYANIQIKDELSRLPGVGEVSLRGQSDYGLRIWLDPDKLAARGLNAGEVTRTIEKQKEARGVDVEKLSDLVVKADGDGRIVYLKDVARLELGAGPSRSRASFHGKPVAALVVRPDGEAAPRKVRAALRDALTPLRERLPKGLDLSVVCDFTTDAEYLLLDLDVPATASSERVEQILSRCAEVLRQAPGVRDVLAMSENPFDLFGGGPCILVGLSPAEDRKAGREEIARTMRAKLGEIKELSVRVRDLSPPVRPAHFGYPIDLAVRGPELGRVREFAKELAGRLSKDKKLTDVWADSASTPLLQRTVDIDRAAAATRGVALEDILATLRLQADSVYVNDFIRFGRTWRVQVRAEPRSGDWIKDLGKLKVRGTRGQMIPLNTLVKVRQTDAPLALDFLDFFPMVEITANPASGVKLDEARKLCETRAEEVRKELRLPAEYRLSWLP